MRGYECKVCGGATALTGACRHCGCPSEVDGSFTRRVAPTSKEVADEAIECIEWLLEQAPQTNDDPWIQRSRAVIERLRT